ncbi:c-type cytochrome [Peristeroidobacter soli]|uniref:c-type cytochrome n=1 Tax=Peristeroidobacter soli TaxID=2497877 RepID=UPI00158DE841|nr:c-type cytochrome [Peristeroidobacter soli]
MKAWLPLIATTVLSTTAIAADNSDLSYCTVCHGAHGNGNPAIRAPKISAMEPWYIRRQLEAFRDGVRGTHPDDAAGHEMQPVGVRLRDGAAMDAAIEYVSTFKPKAPPITVTGDAARGRELYVTCASCHGSNGEGNQTVGAPALADRTDWYLVTQLRNYKAGLRGSDQRDTNGAQMRALAQTLPDTQAIDDVVTYINTLRARR